MGENSKLTDSIRETLEQTGTVFVFDEMSEALVLEVSNCSKGYEVYYNDCTRRPEPCSLDSACEQITKVLGLRPKRWLWAGEPNGHAYKTATGKYHHSSNCLNDPENNRCKITLREYTYFTSWCQKCAPTDNECRRLKWLSQPWLLLDPPKT